MTLSPQNKTLLLVFLSLTRHYGFTMRRLNNILTLSLWIFTLLCTGCWIISHCCSLSDNLKPHLVFTNDHYTRELALAPSAFTYTIFSNQPEDEYFYQFRLPYFWILLVLLPLTVISTYFWYRRRRITTRGFPITSHS